MKNKLNVFDICKGVLVLCLCIFFFFEMHQPSNSKKPFEKVLEATINNVDLASMQQKDNRAIKRFLSILPEQYAQIIYYKDQDSMSANELVIVEFNDNSQANEFKEAMIQRMKSQKNVFDGTIQDQADLVKNGIVFTQANYGIYVVHKDGSVLLTQFKGAL